MINGITFAQPAFFWLLGLIPLIIFFYFFYLRKKTSQITFSGFAVFIWIKQLFRLQMQSLPFILKILAFALAIVALARPQSTSSGQNVTTEGIDIILALDISSSMLAEDLKPNRIEAAKKVADDFIDSRPNDRIGLVVFGGESYTVPPDNRSFCFEKSFRRYPVRNACRRNGHWRRSCHCCKPDQEEYCQKQGNYPSY